MKQAKEQLKREEPRFDEKVEAQFAQLTLQDIRQLLEQKWLNTLIVELENIAHSYSRNVANQIKALDERYKETLDEIQAQRKQAEEAFLGNGEIVGVNTMKEQKNVYQKSALLGSLMIGNSESWGMSLK